MLELKIQIDEIVRRGLKVTGWGDGPPADVHR